MKEVVKSTDPCRALVTEFLPYETPFIFSSIFFYKRNRIGSLGSDPIKSIVLGWGKTIPYTYSVRVSESKSRDLHLIHPSCQVRASQFIEEYSLGIIDRCSVSTFSLRRPSRISSQFYEKRYAITASEVKSDFVDGQENGFGRQYKSYLSYFHYHRYQRLYRFFDSEEFLDIESRFKYQYELDISKCFYNIYTHSISWAIKDKGYSKDNISGKGFEKKIDLLMQDMNYKETNGIVVGPEFSRIFAEIILQKNDVVLLDRLSASNLVEGRDYEIRRYIDNYYVFVNENSVGEKICREIAEVLSSYKLYLNESKSDSRQRPFVSPQGVVVSHIKDLSDLFFNDVFERHENPGWRQDAYGIRAARSRKFTARSFLSKYRNILSANDANIDAASGLLLGIIKKRIQDYGAAQIVSISEKDENVAILRFVDDICSILAYVLKTSLTSKSIDRALQAVVLSRDIFQYSSCKDADKAITHWVESTFFQIFMRDDWNSGESEARVGFICDNQVEFSGFLVVLRHMSGDLSISEDALIGIWSGVLQACNDDAQFPYWIAIAILYYVQESACYDKVKKKILYSCLKWMNKKRFWESSDIFYSFLDFGSYPGFSSLQKSVLWKTFERNYIANYDGKSKSSDVSKFSIYKKEYLSDSYPWFVNWSLEVDILSELSKRELQLDY